MSGETEAQVSGWTVDTLHTFLAHVMDERDRRYEARFNSGERAVAAALASADKASDKADVATEKRFDAVNEFRGQQRDLIATFMPRSEAEQRLTLLSDRVDEVLTSLGQVNSRLDLTAGSTAGSTGERVDRRHIVAANQALVGLIITVVLATITIVGVVLGAT